MPLTTNGGAGFLTWPRGTGCRALLAGTSLLAVTACGTETPARPEAATRLVLPFDAYRTTPGQRATLGDAHNLLVRRCMRARGVAVEPPAEDPALIAALDPGNSRRYGVVDTVAAGRHGYHLARPPSPDTTAAWAAALPAATRDHLYGDGGRGGCLDRASRVLARGAPKADWPWFSRQDALTLERSARTPGVVAAAGRWRACMSRSGHGYPSPEAAIGDRRWDLDERTVTEDEKRTAVADTRCKWSSGLVAAWHAADVELQRALVRDHAARFAALRADLAHRLRRASAVLAADEGGQVG
ncbi:hypothetical protein Nocox_41130 [Nonomuraea coxensis DSM 45129]|uniref:Lipoprotein n=1 Tax=Nonomuraea coxensis DSM 45129 TaxID=1122611 RepID=A0ABX8UDA6_9ACTN|nr:hypothetical protein [Nonomuraea coxensis]QYC45769.1 hypothetical protein Nocox_41130 [Nonomuraea coxensis DSM 45129]